MYSRGGYLNRDFRTCSHPAAGSKHAWALTAGQNSRSTAARSPENRLGPSAVSHFEVVWGLPGGERLCWYLFCASVRSTEVSGPAQSHRWRNRQESSVAGRWESARNTWLKNAVSSPIPWPPTSMYSMGRLVSTLSLSPSAALSSKQERPLRSWILACHQVL